MLILTPPGITYFTIFGFPIYYYGIILAISILIGIYVSHKVAVQEYFLPEIIPDIATSVIIGGILGARLYYCLLNYNIYLKNPVEILALREGGLSIHGAIIGGLIILIYQAKKHHINFLKLCDICSIGMPIAQAIGRWGNFINSEAFGLPSNLPIKMYIEKPFRPDKYFSNEYFHPTFLYESIFDILIFIILYKYFLKKYKNKDGIIFGWYLLLYSIVRFFVEFIRIDCIKYIYGWPLPQIISGITILGAATFLLIKHRK